MDNSSKANLHHIYNNAKYLDMYGGSVIMSVIIISIFVAVNVRNLSTNILSDIEKDWEYKRCMPFYMPLAGIIRPEKSKSSKDVVIDNFNYCVGESRKSVHEKIQTPVTDVMRQAIQIQIANEADQEQIRDVLNQEEEKTKKVQLSFVDMAKTIMYGGQQILVKFKDIFAKIEGVFYTTTYSLVGMMNVMGLMFTSMVGYLRLTAIITATVSIIVAGVLYFLVGVNIVALLFPIAIAKGVTATIMIILFIFALSMVIFSFIVSETLEGSDYDTSTIYPESLYKIENNNKLIGLVDVINRTKSIRSNKEH